jgi:hypothetical protein
MEKANRLRRGPRIASAEVHGEAVLLDLRHGKYYSLNRTGAAVWELLSQPRTLAELHEALFDRFDAEPETLRDDLTALLDDLRLHGLVDDERPEVDS